MIKVLFVIVLLGFISAACTADEIRQCSFACEKAGRAMLKYSESDGCVCGDKTPQEK
jgi:hypothetical protein